MYESLFSPFSLNGITLKNRIIFAPTSLGTSAGSYEETIRRVAAGGCAMIILGDVPVSRTGPHSLFRKKGFSRYQKLCDLAHSLDCKICAQLHQSDSNMKAMLKYIPGVLTKRITADDLRRLLNQEVEGYITTMPVHKVSAISSAFGDAAILAQKAGFDMVQVHGDRMCGSFSSALFNRRTDLYGGSASARARFAVEAVSAIRQALPRIPIDYKLAVRQENPHYGNAGILLEELPVFIPLLEAAGVTSFHVTLANHTLLSDTIPPAAHPFFSGEGCFLRYCDEVKKYTKLPLCGVGGLSSPSFIEEQLTSGRISLAAMSRQLIADPEWPQKAEKNEEDKIRHCIRCNKNCLGGIQRHEGVHCIYDKIQ